MSNDKLQDVMTRQRVEERENALCALLMQPLMTHTHRSFAIVRRHAEFLRDWFAREAGWVLRVERDCARLYKVPADLDDDTRLRVRTSRGGTRRGGARWRSSDACAS